MKKQQLNIKKQISLKQDNKRERKIKKMLEKKQQLAKAKELAFNLNTIKLNGKKRYLKKAVFKYHDLITCYFARLLDINFIEHSIQSITEHTIIFNYQTLHDKYKSLAKRCRAIYLSLTSGGLALNLRRETKTAPIGLKYFGIGFRQINKVIFIAKMIKIKYDNPLAYIIKKPNLAFDSRLKQLYVRGFLPSIYKQRQVTYTYVNINDSLYKTKQQITQYSYGKIGIYRRFLLKTFTGFLKKHSSKTLGKINNYANANILNFKTYIYRRVFINYHYIQSNKPEDVNLTSLRGIRKKSFLVLYSALDMKGIDPLVLDETKSS